MNPRILENYDPQVVAEFIRNDHPQIIAAILSLLSPEFSAKVLDLFSRRWRNDVILRLATMGTVSPFAMAKIEKFVDGIDDYYKNVYGSDKQGGVEYTANVLDCIDETNQHVALDDIRDYDPDLTNLLITHMKATDENKLLPDSIGCSH